VRRSLTRHQLHTVCESAQCPNRGECWSRGTATFLILGNVCTRNCRFCAVLAGSPDRPDDGEPERLAQTVRAMRLRYVVLTSVTRDDLDDGGATMWAACIRAIRQVLPDGRIEVLVPDFQGREELLETVLAAKPDVLGHNIETVPRLYAQARPRADYTRSLQLLSRAKTQGFVTKSGLMLGLGETDDEVRDVLQDLRKIGTDLLTLGQYLQPTTDHLPVARYVSPEQFAAWEKQGQQLGFRSAVAGPLVRSSYHAEQLFEQR
jgi:lipoic acid synthetase